MDTAPILPPFAARPLRPLFTHPATVINGQPEPETITRGSRAAVSLNGQIVAGGGYPAPIRRTASFTVRPRTPVLVNVVTGVPSHPQVPKTARR